MFNRVRTCTAAPFKLMVRLLAWPAFSTKDSNPYTWLLYSYMRRLGVTAHDFGPTKPITSRYDIWHIHWPDYLLSSRSSTHSGFRVAALLGLMDFARARGTRIVWTAHNHHSHADIHPRLEAWMWRQFLGRVDGIIHLTDAARLELRKRFPRICGIPQSVIPLGHYRGVYPNQTERETARDVLAIPLSHRVLLHIGRISPYKGVPELVRAFRGVARDNTMLIVAGSAPRELATTIRAASAGEENRIRLHLENIPDSELQTYFAAADLVVAPYRAITNSSTAMLALSFNRPVLVPALGSLGELATTVGDEWVKTYGEGLSSDILSNALEWACSCTRAAEAPLERFEWDRIASETLRLYEMVLAR